MTEQNAQGETVDVNDPAQQDDTMSVTQEATNSGPDEATSDDKPAGTDTEQFDPAPEPDTADDGPSPFGGEESEAKAEDTPEEEKPVWNVETHGPVRDEIRDQYRVIGE